jgi:site-specific recombinase XerD
VVDKNYPIKVVQRIIGHRDLKNLDYYINLRTEDIKKAIIDRKDY